MNVKKNPFYYINTIIFLIISVYSLLYCINIFDTENIDMNAGLCAVIVSMVLCLMMYLIHATRLRNVLAANPILKTSLEVISVLIFLTLSCVLHVYLMGEFDLDITHEGIVLFCMFMAYLTARMLNQYGFVTLMLLVPWPYFISTYRYNLQELIQIAAVIAGICILSVILFAVRKKRGLRLAAIILFLTVTAVFFFYEMYQAGLTSVYMEDYKQYIVCFNKMFRFTQFGKYYYIAAVMAAIIGGIRLFLGSGSANTLILFIINVLCFFTVTFDLGPMYFHFMYPLLAIAAAGSLGTRPPHEDEEVQLQDNLENVQVKYNKKDVVGLSYVDDSELDRMLEDIEKEHKYIPHKNLSDLSEENDDEIPVELSMYDAALTNIDSAEETSKLQPSEPVYEPAEPVMTPKPEPIAPEPVYEPAEPVMTPASEPIAPEPVYESAEPVTPVPSYETMVSVSEPVIPEPTYESVAAASVYETLEKTEQELQQPEPVLYETEYRYEEEQPTYEAENHYEEQTPVYKPEYHYEEEPAAVEQTPQESYEEPVQEKEPVVPEPIYEALDNVSKEQQPEPAYVDFVQEEPQNLEPQLLIKNPVSFDTERDRETSGNSVDYEFVQSKPMFETMASFFSNNLDVDNAPKFEMSQRDAVAFDAYSASNEIYTPIDSMDELFTNVDAGLQFEEVEHQNEKTYSEDDELIEEPVSIHQPVVDGLEDMIAPVVLDKMMDDDEIIEEPVISHAEPQKNVTMPENIELGVDLEEDFSFGETMSFTDLYDMETVPVFSEAQEIEEAPETVNEETVEQIIDIPVIEEITEPVVETSVTEEMKAPVVEIPQVEEIAVSEYEGQSEPVFEPAAVQTETEEHIEDIPTVSAADELYEEPVAKKKEPDPVKQVNPFAKEDDFFDWSTYDGSVEEDPEPVAEETSSVAVKPQAANDFEEFVWTDEMIKQFSDGGNVTVPQAEIVPVEDDVPEVIEEIAATTVPESVFEPDVTVRVEEPSIQQVLVEKPVVQEVRTESPVQEDSSPVSAAEEEAPQYQVFRSSTNLRFEEPEEPEEETPQYQVYQSSGNFRLEEPEEQEEEEPQYQVYQSSGNFQLEEEEEEIQPTLVTYGGAQQNTEPVPVKPEEKPAAGNKFGDFEFDLDLPDFEPFNPTKR